MLSTNIPLLAVTEFKAKYKLMNKPDSNCNQYTSNGLSVNRTYVAVKIFNRKKSNMRVVLD